MGRNRIICDFDGTLVNIAPIANFVGDWDEFHPRTFDCPPNQAIIDFMALMEEHYEVVVVTGKGDNFYPQMCDWVTKYCFAPDAILMRPVGNFMSDAELKPFLMEQEYGPDWESSVLFALEDRDKMVDAWRALGITCLQCARSLY